MDTYLSRVRRPLSNLGLYFNAGDYGTDYDDSESSEDDEKEFDVDLEQIGRLPSLATLLDTPRLMSLDHYHWLIKRCFSPWGEPRGIVPAIEPKSPPAVGPPDEQSSSTGHNGSARLQMRKISNAAELKLLSEPELRQKIMEVAALGLPDKERDRMVQRLMTDNYYRIKGLKVDERTPSPARHTITDDDMIHVAQKNLERHSEDAEPTFTDHETFGCEHYSRGCKLLCDICNRFYPCRLCHDAAVSDHVMAVGATKVILCMKCSTVQNPSDRCTKCGLMFGHYYCDICKLWENNELGDKPIYHCSDCGICRVGDGLGIDFFHCKTCNVCMSLELENNHKCIENSTECDCPICGEFMFTSRETVVFMKCGHSIHQSCFESHTRSSYKCPTCARSIINMQAQFRILDNEIENSLMPEPFCNWKSIIICNDCSAKSSIAYHILGLKCDSCGSYNTILESVIKPEESDEDQESNVVATASDENSLTLEDEDENDDDIF